MESQDGRCAAGVAYVVSSDDVSRFAIEAADAGLEVRPFTDYPAKGGGAHVGEC